MKTKVIDFEKHRLKQRAAQERAFKKAKAKASDPKHIEKQRSKAKATAQRKIEKQKAKFNDPEYRAKEYAKKTKVKANSSKKSKQVTKVYSSLSPAKKPIKSKGMKGRNPTAEEKRLADKIGTIGCICCLNKGWYTTADQVSEHVKYVSLHHIDGRVKPWSHAMVLPLCQFHHDTFPEGNAPSDLFPIHKGGKRKWYEVNGSEYSLLIQVYEIVAEAMPCDIAAKIAI